MRFEYSGGAEKEAAGLLIRAARYSQAAGENGVMGGVTGRDMFAAGRDRSAGFVAAGAGGLALRASRRRTGSYRGYRFAY